MMTTTQLAEQIKKLITLRRNLSPEPGDLDRIAVERSADEMDNVHQLAEHDLAARLLNARSRQLRDVNAALDRLRKGTYGVCCCCEEEISWGRLQAIPSAARCARCQENQEAGVGDDEDQGEEMDRYDTLRSAAAVA